MNKLLFSIFVIFVFGTINSSVDGTNGETHALGEIENIYAAEITNQYSKPITVSVTYYLGIPENENTLKLGVKSISKQIQPNKSAIFTEEDIARSIKEGTEIKGIKKITTNLKDSNTLNYTLSTEAAGGNKGHYVITPDGKLK